MKTATIFGSSTPTSKEYYKALRLGEELADEFIVINGGYNGTMEASAKGCTEAGGKVIGVCVKGHFVNQSGKPNIYNSKIVLTDDLNKRIEHMLESDHIIIMDGSLGTLQEFVATLVLQHFKKNKQIIVYGSRNERLIKYLHKEKFINDELFASIRFAHTLQELKQHLNLKND